MTGMVRSCQRSGTPHELIRRLAVAAVVIATHHLPSQVWAGAIDNPAHYNALVSQARSGDYQPALDYLGRLPGMTPSQRRDQLIITSWSGRDQAVVDLYEDHADTLARHPDAIFAAARARRNLQQWPQALTMLRELVREHPHQNEYRLTLIMTLADSGLSRQAQDEGAAWVRQQPELHEARLGYGYALMRADKPFAALFEIDQALQLAPNNTSVQREYVFALQRAGLATPALALARESSLLTEAEIQQLEADHLAKLVRMSAIQVGHHEERYRLADQALAKSEALLNQWRDTQPFTTIRVRIDRLGALRNRLAMRQLKVEAERLTDEGVSLPDYARRWYADALLYLRQPHAAADIYRSLIANTNSRDSSWMPDHQQLYYALVEADLLEEANALSRKLQHQEPLYRRIPGTERQIFNGRWLDAQILSANNHVYRDDMPAAEKAYTNLVSDAPGNTGIRASLASVYQLRGWPRRAERQLKVAESTAPVNISVLVGQAETALNLQDWAPFETLADDLAQRYPEALASQRVQKQRKIHHMNELQVTAYTDANNGDGINGSGGFGIDTVIYSQPINQDWRVFGGIGYATGKFEEGRANYNWERAGLEWRVRDHTLSAELSGNHYGHDSKTGWRLAGDHEINDHWSYGWELEGLSRQTPLRALNANTDADRQAAYLRWRADERREWQARISTLEFSDGNDRQQASASGKERLYTSPYLTFDANLLVAASRNSQGGRGLYFNPESDLTVLPGASLNHVLHREYEQIWTQQAYIGLGSYTQHGFGTDVMLSGSYGQRWRWNNQLNTGLTLSTSSRPYDGERELDLALLFDLTYRF